MKDDLHLIAEQYDVVLNEAVETERRKRNAIDNLQTALDVIGLDPLFQVGTTADLVNVLISSFRSGLALAKKENDIAKEHAINAGISAISIIPFADVIKILKFRKLGKHAKPATKLAVAGGKAAKAYGAKKKLERIAAAKSEKSDQDSIDLD
jgi:hypothetical protein